MFALYFELVLFIVLMFGFGRVAGFEILNWNEWYDNEETVEIVIAFMALVYFTVREIYQMYSLRATELLAPEPIKRPDSFAGRAIVLAPRFFALAVVGAIIFLPVLPLALLTCCCCCGFGVEPVFEGIQSVLGEDRSKWIEDKMERLFARLEEYVFIPIVHDPLTAFGFSRAWRRDYWNWIDLATLACAWASFVRAALPGGRLSVNLAAFTAILLWIRLCGFLKLVDIELATFVLMIGRIIIDIKVFLFFLLVIILMFASALYLHLGQRTRSDFGFHDDGAPTGYTTFPKTMLSLYLLGFIGEFDWDTFDTYALRVLICLFIFIVIVVLLNVLIAIVSNSHASSEKTAAGLFYRSRLEYIAEPVSESLPSWLREIEDEAEIKKRLAAALEQHKEDTPEEDASAQINTKRALRASEMKIAVMETKIDKLTEMVQKLLPDDKKPGPGS